MMNRSDYLHRREYYRMRYLPQQLEAARIKVRHLENEAKRYGMTELLEARE